MERRGAARGIGGRGGLHACGESPGWNRAKAQLLRERPRQQRMRAWQRCTIRVHGQTEVTAMVGGQQWH